MSKRNLKDQLFSAIVVDDPASITMILLQPIHSLLLILSRFPQIPQILMTMQMQNWQVLRLSLLVRSAHFFADFAMFGR